MHQILGLPSVGIFGAELGELCAEAWVCRDVDVGGHWGGRASSLDDATNWKGKSRNEWFRYFSYHDGQSLQVLVVPGVPDGGNRMWLAATVCSVLVFFLQLTKPHARSLAAQPTEENATFPLLTTNFTGLNYHQSLPFQSVSC